MSLGISRRGAGVCSLATAALACAAVPAVASATAVRPSDGALSSRLAQLAKPAVRSAPAAAQARALGLAPRGSGSLLREGNRVLVEVGFAGGAAAAVDDLRDAGARIVAVSARYQTVTVAAKPGELRRLADVPRVDSVSEVLAPIASALTCPSGAVVSEGDAQLHAATARTDFAVDGTGVKVGILSDSFETAEGAQTSAAEDAAAGDLPGNGCGPTPAVEVVNDYHPGPEAPKPKDEGRAMAQVVHDLAPGASISFATAFTGLTAFAANIEALATAGAKVIADDVSYFEEPFFQEGPVGAAVSTVTAGGVSYLSSAGNNNLVGEGRNIASREAPAFRDAASCPAGVPAYAQHCMDFNPLAPVDTTFGLKVSPGATLRLDLQWAQPWNGVTTDLDAYLLSVAGTLLVKSENANVVGTQKPFEFLSWTNSSASTRTVRLAIDRCSATCDPTNGGDFGSPRLKFAILENGSGVTSTEYPASSEGDVAGPTIFGHNGAEDAISVGAIRHDASEAPEAFSSRGPVTHYFGPAVGLGAAPPLGTPLVLSKPDVVATDCGQTSFFVPSSVPGIFRFCGTSASAPHVAAVAALMLQKEPLATPAQVRSALTTSAVAVGGSPDPCAVGAGMVDAAAALLMPTPATPPACLPPPPESQPDTEEDEDGSGGEEEVVTTPPPPTPPTTTVEPPPPPPPPEDTPPETFFRQRPAKVIRTGGTSRRAVFKFGASEGGVTFLCGVDGATFHGCATRFVRRFRVGRHVLRVVARDAAGNVDPTPAVYRFRVELPE